MKRFDLYGSCSLSVSEVASAIEERGVATFVAHDSGYKGGPYFRHKADGEYITVQTNSVDSEGYRLEPDFEDRPTLVYVRGSKRWSEPLGEGIITAHPIVGPCP